MALISKSIDEELTELSDMYDSLVQPKKLYRNHNNKVYLALRAFAAGKVGLVDAALALHNRHDPRYCDDLDLYSTAKIVGTEFKQGAGSLVRITILNKDTAEAKVLKAGVYHYQSTSGMTFSFQVQNDYAFDPEESKTVFAISREKGSFPIANNVHITLFRSDGDRIDSSFIFSCEDNTGQLGYPDEDAFEFRSRLLNDANRHDHLKELELKIRNLPNIFECNLKFNETDETQEYDGIPLAPRELLVIITGVPTDQVAELVVKDVLYKTHQVDPDNVVYYYNDIYIQGKYPVYFTYHDKTDFSLSITYQYDRDKLKSSQVEDAINSLFKPYKRMVTHIDTFSEEDAYKVLSALQLPNVKVLDANVFDSLDDEVPYVRIPKTRLAHLTNVVFTSIETGGSQ
jgi:hypothetical protein